MNITFKNPGYTHSIDSIQLFLSGDETPFWSAPILHFYPQIDKAALAQRNRIEKQQYLNEVFQDIYNGLSAELNSRAIRYHTHFQSHKNQIEAALSDAFDLDSRTLFNDLTGNVTLNPISPRFLKERYFDIFYLNSEKGALGLSLHEVIHYFWFHVWNEHFGDHYEEYETPSLKWILSEMVVEAIMSDERLSSLNPYFPKENGGCIYPYFQSMIIDGSRILDTLHTAYQQNNITDFMEISYAYCSKHEDAIRKHIEAAERAF